VDLGLPASGVTVDKVMRSSCSPPAFIPLGAGANLTAAKLLLSVVPQSDPKG
jgi:hypothetical protein